jgi:hypothetical protein
MAVRPIFIPNKDSVGVLEKSIVFKWHPGMAASQKKKSIVELHKSAQSLGIKKTLEISSKSEVDLGISLSAFNLLITTKKQGKTFTVETAFQGSKVFERGGPFVDLLGLDSRSAKKDIRLKESGNLIAFRFFNKEFPLVPRTYFYDWLYINALVQHDDYLSSIQEYDGYSDIEFNPKKSINCQAHSVALYCSLKKNEMLNTALESPKSFLDICSSHYINQSRNIGIQRSII